MPRFARPLVLIAVCSFSLLCTACSSNAKKIVGKWKMESMTNKDGKEQKFADMGFAPVMEFTADGNVKVSLDTSNLSPEMKQLMEQKKGDADIASESKQVGKYKVSGSNIQFLDMKDADESPFGKKQGGKLSFSGDNLTITGEDGSVKLIRMK
jgi:hypothetical protein